MILLSTFDRIVTHLSNIIFAYGSIYTPTATTTDSKHSNRVSRLLSLFPNCSHFLLRTGRRVPRTSGVLRPSPTAYAIDPMQSNMAISDPSL